MRSVLVFFAAVWCCGRPGSAAGRPLRQNRRNGANEKGAKAPLRLHKRRQGHLHLQGASKHKILSASGGGRIDMEAASEGAAGVYAASREDLTARAIAIAKQNALLRRAEAVAREELRSAKAAPDLEPSITLSPAWDIGHNSTAVVTEQLESISTESLRALVVELASENAILQREEISRRATLRRLIVGSRPTNLTTNTAASAPPLNWNCEELVAPKVKGSFSQQRFDGADQPTYASDKWAVWFCGSLPPSDDRSDVPASRGAIWLAKRALFCEDLPGTQVSRLSQDEDTSAAARMRGPDELFGTLHGAEAIALRWRYRGSCAYVSFFYVPSGPYHLQLVHFRENFAGLDETRNYWPPLHFDFIIGRNGAFVDVPLSHGASNTTLGQRLAAADQAYRRLPFCSLQDIRSASRMVRDGSFVYVHADYGAMFGNLQSWRSSDFGRHWQDAPSAREVRAFRPLRSRTFQWPDELQPPMKVHWDAEGTWWLFAVDPTKYEWRPRKCQLGQYHSASDRRQCLENRRIVVAGDSNAHALQVGMLETSCRAKVRATKLEKKPTCFPIENGPQPFESQQCTKDVSLTRSFGDCKRLSFASQVVHYGDTAPARLRESRDVYVAGFGQWPAARAHYSLRRYRGAVENWFAHFNGSNTQATRIWTSTIPLVRNDAWVRAQEDWRSLTRLQSYNEHADATAESNGWFVLDEWNLTLPFLLAPREDIAHAAESQRQHHLHILFHVLCNTKEETPSRA